jgi:transcriptional regulator with GAF, ATPase, and Fis domain
MAGAASGYLVVRREDGFGDVFALIPGQRYTLGRAATNRIILKDELCSREHAEVFHADGSWRARDLNSLNGTRINDQPLDTEWELEPNDEIGVGHSRLIFVQNMSQLPKLPPAQPGPDNLAIKARLGNTRFMTPIPPPNGSDAGSTTTQQNQLERQLSLLFKMALDTGNAADVPEVVSIVLDVLLQATPAAVVAVLSVKPDRDLEVMEYRHRDASAKTYNRVSQYVSNEVLSSREAVLAENVAEDRHLRSRESLSDMGATSLICAPVVFRDRIHALIHIYCTENSQGLDRENLEFALAVAKHLGNAIYQIQRQQSLSAENRSLRDQLRVESELVGNSPVMKDIDSQIGRVASTNATILVRGESGSGKELVARAIHYSSPRKDGPFVCLNCAALTETLLESELFGHEKGAFTGATDKKIGKFEAADTGTIFLDEIGEMNVGTQAKFLRVLEGHPFERVGGSTPIRVNVRVVAATNQALEEGIQNGKFRRDLFYRLQVIEIRVPPLRDRRDDIGLLADHFLKRFVRETGRKIRGFSAAAMKKMEDYHWPGNVRELRNVVERAVALSGGPILDSGDIWLSSLEAVAPEPLPYLAPSYQALSLEEVEKQHILRTLEHTDWNKSQAATILNIERSTLDRKIKAFELKR